jgi:hypothetical protein
MQKNEQLTSHEIEQKERSQGTKNIYLGKTNLRARFASDMDCSSAERLKRIFGYEPEKSNLNSNSNS